MGPNFFFYLGPYHGFVFGPKVFGISAKKGPLFLKRTPQWVLILEYGPKNGSFVYSWDPIMGTHSSIGTQEWVLILE